MKTKTAPLTTIKARDFLSRAGDEFTATLAGNTRSFSTREARNAHVEELERHFSKFGTVEIDFAWKMEESR